MLYLFICMRYAAAAAGDDDVGIGYCGYYRIVRYIRSITRYYASNPMNCPCLQVLHVIWMATYKSRNNASVIPAHAPALTHACKHFRSHDMHIIRSTVNRTQRHFIRTRPSGNIPKVVTMLSGLCRAKMPDQGQICYYTQISI